MNISQVVPTVMLPAGSVRRCDVAMLSKCARVIFERTSETLRTVVTREIDKL